MQCVNIMYTSCFRLYAYWSTASIPSLQIGNRSFHHRIANSFSSSPTLSSTSWNTASINVRFRILSASLLMTPSTSSRRYGRRCIVTFGTSEIRVSRSRRYSSVWASFSSGCSEDEDGEDGGEGGNDEATMVSRSDLIQRRASARPFWLGALC